MAYDESTVTFPAGQTSGTEYVDIPFTASYIAIQNPTNATVYFAPGKLAGPLSGARSVGATKAFTGQMRSTQTLTVYFVSGTGIASDNNEIVCMFSDSPIQLSVSDNANVTNITGTVTANFDGPITVQASQALPVDIQAGKVDVTGSSISINNEQINTIVANPQTQPVPTVPQAYYGTSSDGSFNPPQNFQFQNTANQADIRNFTSVNIPSGITVSWKNPAHYTVWFVQGDVVINGLIQTADATPNVSSSQPSIKLFQGAVSVQPGGAGGAGGKASSNTTQISVTPGGSASPYGPGSGSGGNAGNIGGGGAGAGNGGYGASANGSTQVAGGQGTNGAGTSKGGLPSGTWLGTGGDASTSGGATLIIIASGSITIGGTLISNGGNGGAGATPSGGYAGGGGGGAGGGSVLLYSGSTVNVTGTINVNGGTGGARGTDTNNNNATAGANGQAGTVVIYQYNNQIAG